MAEVFFQPGAPSTPVAPRTPLVRGANDKVSDHNRFHRLLLAELEHAFGNTVVQTPPWTEQRAFLKNKINSVYSDLTLLGVNVPEHFLRRHLDATLLLYTRSRHVAYIRENIDKIAADICVDTQLLDSPVKDIRRRIRVLTVNYLNKHLNCNDTVVFRELDDIVHDITAKVSVNLLNTFFPNE